MSDGKKDNDSDMEIGKKDNDSDMVIDEMEDDIVMQILIRVYQNRDDVLISLSYMQEYVQPYVMYHLTEILAHEYKSYLQNLNATYINYLIFRYPNFPLICSYYLQFHDFTHNINHILLIQMICCDLSNPETLSYISEKELIPILELSLHKSLHIQSNINTLTLNTLFDFLYYVRSEVIISQILYILFRRIDADNFSASDRGDYFYPQQNVALLRFMEVIEIK